MHQVELSLSSPIDAMARSNEWTRLQLEVAMNLYCTVPFGRFHRRNPLIIEIAGLIGRTPSALAMKLCNIASLDPFHRQRGVKGLKKASDADREIWAEFQCDWDRYAFESEAKIADLRGLPLETVAVPGVEELPREGIDRERLVKQRVNQHFFRKAVLAAYNQKCCITGLGVPELLNASHIIPWAARKETRVNPANGLCLNALHDRAFDRGLIGVSDKQTVMIAPELKRLKKAREASKTLLEFDGAPVLLPDRFRPLPEFLAWHRENRFRS